MVKMEKLKQKLHQFVMLAEGRDLNVEERAARDKCRIVLCTAQGKTFMLVYLLLVLVPSLLDQFYTVWDSNSEI